MQNDTILPSFQLHFHRALSEKDRKFMFSLEKTGKKCPKNDYFSAIKKEGIEKGPKSAKLGPIRGGTPYARP